MGWNCDVSWSGFCSRKSDCNGYFLSLLFIKNQYSILNENIQLGCMELHVNLSGQWNSWVKEHFSTSVLKTEFLPLQIPSYNNVSVTKIYACNKNSNDNSSFTILHPIQTCHLFIEIFHISLGLMVLNTAYSTIKWFRWFKWFKWSVSDNQ